MFPLGCLPQAGTSKFNLVFIDVSLLHGSPFSRLHVEGIGNVPISLPLSYSSLFAEGGLVGETEEGTCLHGRLGTALPQDIHILIPVWASEMAWRCPCASPQNWHMSPSMAKEILQM